MILVLINLKMNKMKVWKILEIVKIVKDYGNKREMKKVLIFSN